MLAMPTADPNAHTRRRFRCRPGGYPAQWGKLVRPVETTLMTLTNSKCLLNLGSR